MLEVKNLTFKHKGENREILREIIFTASPKEIITILGPNGAGKSTLFKCISGIWNDYEGEIRFQGERVDKFSFERRAKFFAIVPQEHEPPFSYSVLDVVLTGRASYIGLFSSPKRKDYEKAEEALELVGIKHLKDKAYTKISGGERQLTLIARALVQEAPVLLLDEPTSHLDFRNQFIVLNTVKKLAKEKNLTVIMTLHDPNLASLFSDKIVVLKKGKVFHNGCPSEVIKKEILEKVYEIPIGTLNNEKLTFVYPNLEI